MFPLILMGLAGAAGLYFVADLVGVFSDTSQTAVQEIEDGQLEEKLPLLDENVLIELEAALRSDPLLTEAIPNESQFTLAEYNMEFGTVEGTENADLIVIPEEFQGMQDMVDAGAGDDVVLANSGDTPIFGGTGNDTVLAGGGFDQVFGGEGDDVLAGQDGADLIIGGRGSDMLYGGAGDDNIFDSAYLNDYVGQSDVDLISAGAGNDGIIIEDGINLISLGEGEDHVMVYTQSGGSPGAVITDFNASEDALLIGVHAPDAVFANGANTLKLDVLLSEIETPLGLATLVEPAVTSQDLADQLSGANVSYAVLLGIKPADLEGATIEVYATGKDAQSFAEDGIHTLATAMGATRI